MWVPQKTGLVIELSNTSISHRVLLFSACHLTISLQGNSRNTNFPAPPENTLISRTLNENKGEDVDKIIFAKNFFFKMWKFYLTILPCD